MRTFAKISQVAHYVPEQLVSNDDLAQIMDTSDDWIASRTGIRQRRIVVDENTSDLASQVAQSLLDKSGVVADEIDFIIVATITPDSAMPSTAARVQAAIGAKKAFAYDLVAACSGFVFALSTADKLISSGIYQKGIVIGAEVCPRQSIGRIGAPQSSLVMGPVVSYWKLARSSISWQKSTERTAVGALA